MSALTTAEIRQSADWIASVQLPDGMVPWYPGSTLTPGTMSKRPWPSPPAAAGPKSSAPFEWLAAKQLPEGSWCAAYVPVA